MAGQPQEGARTVWRVVKRKAVVDDGRQRHLHSAPRPGRIAVPAMTRRVSIASGRSLLDRRSKMAAGQRTTSSAGMKLAAKSS